jgi:hypothetical protein
MINRIINILTKPKEEWNIISNEKITQRDIFLKYSCYLAFIPAVSRIIELSFVGIPTNYFGIIFNKKYNLIGSISYALSGYFLSLGAVYLASKISVIPAKFFNISPDFLNSLKVVSFSLTPFWLCGVFLIYAPLNFLFLLSLYGCFLMYLGLKRVINVPKDSILIFLMVNIIVLFVLFFIVGMISERILDLLYVPGSELPKELLNKFN